jgi:hypothetical protein
MVAPALVFPKFSFGSLFSSTSTNQWAVDLTCSAFFRGDNSLKVVIY